MAPLRMNRGLRKVLTISISVESLSLIELSDRVSDVMKSRVADSLPLTGPLLAISHIFGQFNGTHIIHISHFIGHGI